MRIRTRPDARGSAFVITLLTAAVIGIAMASYLALVSHQHRSHMRSLAWNSCIPVLESGIEEALAHIHYKGTQLHRGITAPLLANGWQLGLDGRFYKGPRQVGTDGSYYEVSIQAVHPPIIEASGYVPAPLAPAPLGMIQGGSQPTLFVKRKVRVTTKGRPFWSGVLLAKGAIKLNGNGIATDSFDSSETPNGQYHPAYARDNGDVGTTGGLINAGNADIKGDLSTAPGGSAKVGKNGSVGDTKWVDGNNSGIQDGHFRDDVNIDIPDVDLPPAFAAAPRVYPGINLIGPGLTNFTYSLVGSAAGDPLYFKSSSLSGKVHVKGNVALLVNDAFTLGSKDYIYVEPGSKLTVYVAAKETTISGSIYVDTALNFTYFGLNSNKAIKFNGNGQFTGAIYAPHAEFTMSGGGSNAIDFIGAAVVKTISMNGHFNFHFDEALAKLAPQDYVMNSWDELDPNAP
jgi:hypothetical protein